MKAPLFTQTGERKGEIALAEQIFSQKINPGLMHEMVRLQQNNARVDTAMTLTKGQVRGGGRKPYKQKGTGNARQGSIRNPHYTGGGVAFGPRGNRNYEIMMPKKQRRAALLSGLSLKAKEEKIVVLQDFKVAEPKTKLFAALLKKLPVERKILLVLPESNGIIEKTVHNLPNVHFVSAQYLNLFDILGADSVLFLEAALKKTETLFALS